MLICFFSSVAAHKGWQMRTTHGGVLCYDCHRMAGLSSGFGSMHNGACLHPSRDRPERDADRAERRSYLLPGDLAQPPFRTCLSKSHISVKCCASIQGLHQHLLLDYSPQRPLRSFKPRCAEPIQRNAGSSSNGNSVDGLHNRLRNPCALWFGIVAP